MRKMLRSISSELLWLHRGERDVVNNLHGLQVMLVRCCIDLMVVAIVAFVGGLLLLSLIVFGSIRARLLLQDTVITSPGYMVSCGWLHEGLILYKLLLMWKPFVLLKLVLLVSWARCHRLLDEIRLQACRHLFFMLRCHMRLWCLT